MPQSESLSAGAAPGGRPSGVVAWVQGLPLVPGVCDHAAWAAGRLGTSIELLQLVDEPNEAATPGAGLTAEARAAARRLAERGATALELCLAHGRVADALRQVSRGADLLVVGRPPPLGLAPAAAELAAVVRASRAPVLITGDRFAPIECARVVEDPEEPDPVFADSVLLNPLLDGMPLRRTAIGRSAAQAAGAGAAAPLAGGAQLEVLVLSRRVFATAAGRPLHRLARALVLSPRRLLFC